LSKQIGLALLIGIFVMYFFGPTASLIVGGLMVVVTLIDSSNTQNKMSVAHSPVATKRNGRNNN